MTFVKNSESLKVLNFFKLQKEKMYVKLLSKSTNTLNFNEMIYSCCLIT